MTDLERLYNMTKYLWFHKDHDVDEGTKKDFYLETSAIVHKGNWIYTAPHGLTGESGFALHILRDHLQIPENQSGRRYISNGLDHYFNQSKLRMDVAFGATNEYWVDLKTCAQCVTGLIEGLMPRVTRLVEADAIRKLFDHLRDEEMRQLGIL